MTRRVRCKFSGIVQGVGFRPFIYRLAVSLGLVGFVRNTPGGVTVEIEGNTEAVDSFLSRWTDELPTLASVTGFETVDIGPGSDTSFTIIASGSLGAPDVHITPDTATCPDCLREFFDPADRRYGYPFINCTNCGPRLTIITDIPYDRKNTSMDSFPLCRECGKEYMDPADRRFHAEPNACPVCGPRLSFADAQGRPIVCNDALEKTVEVLKQGFIVAVKGLGGFHLCADAAGTEALARLRERKYREEKPLAVMVRDIPSARLVAEISAEEERLLSGIERPIVLVRKKDPSPLSGLVAPGMARLGIMLPYAPLHHLLLARGFDALVMTSANQTDEPICTGNDEAVRRLSGIADFFLFHDRDIVVRCDDSVAFVAENTPRLMRRSRGYVPRPVLLERSFPPVLGLGAHLKATACVIKEDFAFLSPHVGDMETPEARDFFHESVSLMKRITRCEPLIVGCDLHPEYYTTLAASRMEGCRVVAVQHHHAHIASCMAENRISGKVIGLSMDGTGFGPDGTVWGGEFLVADEAGFERAGHIGCFPLPGGDAAVKQPWRVAAALLMEAFGDGWHDLARDLGIVPQNMPFETMEAVLRQKIHTVPTSSLGRVFDAVACLLGIRQQVSFEGQAAMELEACANASVTRVLDYDLRNEEGLVLDLIPAVRQIVRERIEGRPVTELAGAFHATLVHAFVQAAERIRDESGLNRAVLSGGCFQNRILLEGCLAGLRRAGFEVYSHCIVPTNDGGISLGQALVAGTVAGRG